MNISKALADQIPEGKIIMDVEEVTGWARQLLKQTLSIDTKVARITELEEQLAAANKKVANIEEKAELVVAKSRKVRELLMKRKPEPTSPTFPAHVKDTPRKLRDKKKVNYSETETLDLTTPKDSPLHKRNEDFTTPPQSPDRHGAKYPPEQKKLWSESKTRASWDTLARRTRAILSAGPEDYTPEGWFTEAFQLKLDAAAFEDGEPCRSLFRPSEKKGQ